MSRPFARRQPHRLLRARPIAQRATHGLDLALVTLQPVSRAEPESTQRVDQRTLRALAAENALLARELGRVQARCTRWRDECATQVERLEASLMRTRGDNIVNQTRLAVLRDALAAPREPMSATLRGRRVLCVGGRARQVPVYRALVERAGGFFVHVDGVDPNCLPELQRALAEADLVILQPGYACQGACRAVEAHCARHGVRCVQLDKACVNGFAAGLQRGTAGA